MASTTTFTTSSSASTSSLTSSASFSSIITLAQSTTSPVFPAQSPPPTNDQNNNNGGFGGNGSGNGNGIASSAALYLYTFLATLVLLLSVSAAIVVRSFILRRRHRRMVEEAIRNGTWVPPVPPSGRAPRVDLSKKPVMWEAYLGGGGIYRAEKGGRGLVESSLGYHGFNGKGGGGGPLASCESGDGSSEWECIRPFSATLLHPTVAMRNGGSGLKGPLGSAAAAAPSGGEDIHGEHAHRTRPSLVQRMGAGVRHILRTSSTLPNHSPLPNSAADLNASASANNSATGGEAENGEAGAGERPPMVKVAVLIAMPSPPKPSSATSSSSVSPSHDGPSTSSMVLSPTANHPLSGSTNPPQLSSSLDDTEQPLPVLEMGVAEVVLVNHDEDGERSSGEMGRIPPGKDVGRDSASMTAEV